MDLEEYLDECMDHPERMSGKTMWFDVPASLCKEDAGTFADEILKTDVVVEAKNMENKFAQWVKKHCKFAQDIVDPVAPIDPLEPSEEEGQAEDSVAKTQDAKAKKDRAGAAKKLQIKTKEFQGNRQEFQADTAAAQAAAAAAEAERALSNTRPH